MRSSRFHARFWLKARMRVRADVHGERSEIPVRALTVNSDFVLRALAARKLLQQRDFLRCRAAGEPVIRAIRGENNARKDQVVDEPAAHGNCWKGRFSPL